MSKVQTRAQADLAQAAGRVSAISGDENKGWAKIYGGLCYSFPILVHTAGLAQAWAFTESKGTVEKGKKPNDREKAHARILEDVKALLPPGFDPGKAEVRDYMNATRRVLAAFVFYKRFAKSILNAEASNDTE